MNGDITHSDQGPPSLPRKVSLERASDGYGFNLHGEKGIHGQFISAIDDGSPAQKNDLRVGDRVIAVNDEDVEELTHAKVVDRIRAGGNSVTLLVVDDLCDQYYKTRGAKIPHDRFETVNENQTVNESQPAPEVEESEVSNVVAESESLPEDTEKENVEATSAEPVEPIVEEVVPEEEEAKDNDHTADYDAYDEVIPKARNEEKPAEIPDETPLETATEPPANDTILTTTTTTTTTEATVDGPTLQASETSPQFDMAAARPKPKRHEVKRATQDWKQKYDDFNKL